MEKFQEDAVKLHETAQQPLPSDSNSGKAGQHPEEVTPPAGASPSGSPGRGHPWSGCDGDPGVGSFQAAAK